jgi:hypothetical protein
MEEKNMNVNAVDEEVKAVEQENNDMEENKDMHVEDVENKKVTNETADEAVENDITGTEEDDEDKYPVEVFCKKVEMITDAWKDPEITDEEKEKLSDVYNELMNEIIVREYVPIQYKHELLASLLESAVTDDGHTQRIDEFMYRFEMRMAVVVLYTRLSLGFTKEDGTDATLFDVYDLLNERGLIDALIDYIDDSEIQELDDVAKAIKSQFYEEHNTTEAVYYRTLDNIKEFGNDVLGIIDTILASNPDQVISVLDSLKESFIEYIKDNGENSDNDVTEEEDDEVSKKEKTNNTEVNNDTEVVEEK